MHRHLIEHCTHRRLPAGRGRGPGGQAVQFGAPAGRCLVPGCGEVIDGSRLMCRRDWYAVPRPLRDLVWAFCPAACRRRVYWSAGSSGSLADCGGSADGLGGRVDAEAREIRAAGNAADDDPGPVGTGNLDVSAAGGLLTPERSECRPAVGIVPVHAAPGGAES
jgi:hypothetical protein